MKEPCQMTPRGEVEARPGLGYHLTRRPDDLQTRLTMLLPSLAWDR